MRGALHFLHEFLCQGRIIPAYAGSTDGDVRPSSSWQDHPRVCGEHLAQVPASPYHQGSSPRMRGARLQRLLPVLRLGIIPAYAGSTASSRVTCMPWPDHPRVCGEHVDIMLTGRSRQGSSPRMRGARMSCSRTQRWMGIIPAYAGSTLPSGPSLPCGRDHPRVCGEHIGRYSIRIPRQGSSPRMRGAPPISLSSAATAGIIPAYAGSTMWATITMPNSGDHPRVCGEH